MPESKTVQSILTDVRNLQNEIATTLPEAHYYALGSIEALLRVYVEWKDGSRVLAHGRTVTIANRIECIRGEIKVRDLQFVTVVGEWVIAQLEQVKEN